MSIFDSIGKALKSQFGVVWVEEFQGIITIGGINTDNLLADINKIWGNVRVVKIIFSGLNKHNASFYSFYGVEVLYILQQCWEYKKSVSGKFRIRHAIEQLKTNTWLRRIDVDYPSILNYDKLKLMYHKPFEHQMGFLNMYDQKTQKMGINGFLLAADPGAGKTIASLALSVCLEAEVTIVISPKSLAENVWVHDTKEEMGEDVSYWASTENVPLRPGFKYYIFHFDAIGKAFELVNWFRSKKTIIILDESHNFNDSKSLRSIKLIDLCHQTMCHHIIFSSGTPLKMLGYEVITLLRCIDPLFNDGVEVLFRKIFGVSSKRAVDILRHRIGLIGHKIPREVFMHVATPIVKQIKVKIPNGKKYTVANVKLEMKAYIKDRLAFYSEHTKKYLTIYEDAIRIYARTIKTQAERDALKKYMDFIVEIRKGFDPSVHKDMAHYCNEFEKKKISPALTTPQQRKDFKDARSIVKYVHLKVLGEALGKVLSKKRAECHCEMIPYSGVIDIVLNADKKTLCFTSFVDVVKTAKEYFEGHGLKTAEVYGETNKDINSIIGKFKSDPNVNPLIATLQSMSAGVTLVNCSVLIYFDLPFRDYLWQQGSARLYRIGQDAQTYIYECVLDTGNEPNISTRSQDIMEYSRQQVELIMGKGISEKEMSGIVKRLNMNPETKFERALHIFQDLFR